jgi:hypothetical protein
MQAQDAPTSFWKEESAATFPADMRDKHLKDPASCNKPSRSPRTDKVVDFGICGTGVDEARHAPRRELELDMQAAMNPNILHPHRIQSTRYLEL